MARTFPRLVLALTDNACHRAFFCGWWLLFFLTGFGQADSSISLSFDFNDHTFDETHHLVPPARAVGVNLTQDRFGNEASAVYLGGNLYSYLNLGTSSLLKSKNITVSLWVNITRIDYAGRGTRCNALFEVKNGPQDDFYNAYAIGFDWGAEKFSVGSTKDSVTEAGVVDGNKIIYGKWYHLAFTSDAHELVFYVNGKISGKSKKDFETQFLTTDSVMIGHSANKKNERFTLGSFDDIRIFHRVLSPEEILALYEEPDPNRSRLIFFMVLKWLGIAAGIVAVSFLLVWQRRRALKQAQEKLDINRKLHEMETRTLKAQMNPHFIFNALNSIKQFVMMKENDKAELYLTKFSKLIRELLESNLNESLTIAEEVGILKGYLEMESLRFGNSFSFSISVDEQIAAEHLHIPHLMVQPFVENAIWHGLLSKEGDRSLWIRFDYDTPKTVLCTVEDNGLGRKNSSFRENTFKKKSLALSFVQQRLELMKKNLGVDCNVQIFDKEDGAGKSLGTLVSIILPYLNH